MAPDDPARARAALIHALSEAERSGSTCLPRDELMRRTGTLLGRPAPGDEILKDADVVVLEGTWVFRAETAALEAELAEQVRALLDGDPSDRLRVPASADGLLGEDIELAAPSGTACAKRSSTGCRSSPAAPAPARPPASGRSARSRPAARRSVLLVAPTGRAAVRMAEATARRLHGPLGARLDPRARARATMRTTPLRCDLLIVDETSMANLELLVTLLRAVGPRHARGARGDADQLAPVGAGKPFADLVATPAGPDRPARAHLPPGGREHDRAGRPRGPRRRRAGFRAAEDMQRDLFLIERPDPRRAREEIVTSWPTAARALRRRPGRDIQVFAPVYRGELGIDALNTALRERAEP